MGKGDFIRPIITFKHLLDISKKRKTLSYYYLIKKYKNCFTNKFRQNIKRANGVTRNIKNNNSAHGAAGMFRWAFDQLYGYDKFNHKWIESRPGEISKFTTRIDHYQISLIRQKFYEWINLDCKNMIKNKVEHVKLCRLKIYHAFEALLCSGMRIGEFCNIDWSKSPAHRFSNSQIDSSVRAEIVINTEKTCKQREIYVPLACYRFFVEHKIVMKSKMIEEGFRMFNRWANFDFYWSAHSLRRTLATMMSELNINISAIALALGNTPRTVLTHYIISSIRNVDATDIANCSMNGTLIKTGNMFLNKDWMQVKNQNNQLEYFMNMHAKTFCKRLDKN